MLKKTLESPLDCKEIQPVHPKGSQSWIFIGRTDAEAETPILGDLMQRTVSFEKTLTLGKIEGWRRRGWQRMRWLDGITDEWTRVWVNSGSWTGRPGMLQSMVRKEWDMTEWLNWTELMDSALPVLLQSYPSTPQSGKEPPICASAFLWIRLFRVQQVSTHYFNILWQGLEHTGRLDSSHISIPNSWNCRHNKCLLNFLYNRLVLFTCPRESFREEYF